MKTRYLVVLALLSGLAIQARPVKRTASQTPKKQSVQPTPTTTRAISSLQREQRQLLQQYRQRAKRTVSLRRKNDSLAANIERLQKSAETA